MCIGMQNGSFSSYYNVSSPIHSLSPLCKILTLFVFAFMTIIGSKMCVMCSLFLILVFLIVISNVPYHKYFDILFCMRFLYLFIFIISLFFVDFYDSIIMISRVSLFVLYLAVLLYTTTINELSYGLSLLLRPLSFLGISIFKISLIISLALNFVPYLFIETDRIIKVQTSRGVNCCKCSFIDRFRFVVIPSFVLSFRRFIGICETFKFRTFNDSVVRGSIYDFRFNFYDIYMISCHILILTFVLIKEVVL